MIKHDLWILLFALQCFNMVCQLYWYEPANSPWTHNQALLIGNFKCRSVQSVLERSARSALVKLVAQPADRCEGTVSTATGWSCGSFCTVIWPLCSLKSLQSGFNLVQMTKRALTWWTKAQVCLKVDLHLIFSLIFRQEEHPRASR